MNDTKSKVDMPKQLNNLDDVIQLCTFAMDATGKNDDYSKGMCAGLQYVIDCTQGRLTE